MINLGWIYKSITYFSAFSGIRMEDGTMVTMTVNGRQVVSEKDEKLLTFLRETLGLTSVKNGCSEGACGTCMILVDGRATKACVLKTSKCAGKSIVTCEGLTPRERDVYAYAFTSCGAVQCGFCTPAWS